MNQGDITPTGDPLSNPFWYRPRCTALNPYIQEDAILIIVVHIVLNDVPTSVIHPLQLMLKYV